jgi:hypothetical protein
MKPIGAALLATVAVIGACDPCAGTLSCEQAPRVAIVGQILDQSTGAPVAGARIEMRPSSGPPFLSSVAGTTTGSQGTFEVELLTGSIGDAVVTIRVASPGKPPYDVLQVPTRATISTGEATVLRPWVSANPTLPYVVELYLAGTSDDRVANSQVVFRRTSGVRLFRDGVELTTTSAMTNDAGWVFPFFGLTSDNAGDVVGDLVVYFSATDSAVVPGLVFPAVPIFGPQLGLARIGVGPT